MFMMELLGKGIRYVCHLSFVGSESGSGGTMCTSHENNSFSVCQQCNEQGIYSPRIYIPVVQISPSPFPTFTGRHHSQPAPPPSLPLPFHFALPRTYTFTRAPSPSLPSYLTASSNDSLTSRPWATRPDVVIVKKSKHTRSWRNLHPSLPPFSFALTCVNCWEACSLAHSTKRARIFFKSVRRDEGSGFPRDRGIGSDGWG